MAMSFVIAAPEMVASAASDLAGVGSMIDQAHATAAASTTAVLPAAADEVSAAIAALFSSHAQGFQALGAQAATFHAQFVQLMNAGAGAYAGAEAANASPLQAVEQQVLGVINAPTQVLLGRPLIGNAPTGPRGLGLTAGPAGS
jgi:PE family